MSEYLNSFYDQFRIKIPRTSRNLIMNIDQGLHAIGTKSHYFVTRNIGPCSGYILRDSSKEFYATYHSYPHPDTTDPSIEELHDFAMGVYRPIHGPLSTEKMYLENHLTSALMIAALAEIMVDTKGEKFDALLSPSENRLYISIPNRSEAFHMRAF